MFIIFNHKVFLVIKEKRQKQKKKQIYFLKWKYDFSI